MVDRAPFLKTKFGGYHHRQLPTEDSELTHVGPETPCGEYFRRFWQPVCYADDLRELPVRVKILAEELVVFRDQRGAVGLLELHCPHRGTSLEFGLVGERGIRCCYHGWLFDVDGTILETPGEPPDSTLKDRLCHGAYPTHEAHDIVFAYMGPPDRMPPFPTYDSLQPRPGFRIMPGRKYFYPCNWLQILENTMDPAHTAFLHTIVSGAVFTEQFGVLPELDFVETPVGCIYVATRRVGDHVWARMVENVMPNLQQVAPIWEDGQRAHGFSGPMMSRWIVPLDDTNTMFVEVRHVSETAGETPGWWADRGIMLPGQLAMDTYEQSQRTPGDYEAQVSQRPIALHGMEHLGATDRGVTMFRKLVRQGIRAVREGQDPMGVGRDGRILPTFCNDTVVVQPPTSDLAMDAQAMRATGRRLAEGYVREPPLLGQR
ncbi:MAG: aromatic ring-hydroxylating dioxygenase subunit alpha [Acetobacteraceae bacterium]|nr:aromatic ring-hydroxylating dioxygenase subunit alpha [Acetobacteraceae bacterium]